MPSAFRPVLFDWRGTLFRDEGDAAWIRASAAAIGQTLNTHEVNARVEMLGAAAEHPQVVAACQSADCSAELHRAAVLLELRLAGFDDALASESRRCGSAASPIVLWPVTHHAGLCGLWAAAPSRDYVLYESDTSPCTRRTSFSTNSRI
jgi:hypothetical protein